MLARGRDDASRLVAGELVYTGVVRTPLMALARRGRHSSGEWVPLMAEYFATTADVYRLTGQLPEGADQHPAADGGEKTGPASARRLARMIGRDSESAPLAAWRELAGGWLRAAAPDRGRLRPTARAGGLSEEAPVVAAGVGTFSGGGTGAPACGRCFDFAEPGAAPGKRLNGSPIAPRRWRSPGWHATA